jgi:hypothetical protein
MHERRSDERKRAELYAVKFPSCIENKKPKQKKTEI